MVEVQFQSIRDSTLVLIFYNTGASQGVSGWMYEADNNCSFYIQALLCYLPSSLSISCQQILKGLDGDGQVEYCTCGSGSQEVLSLSGSLWISSCCHPDCVQTSALLYSWFFFTNQQRIPITYCFFISKLIGKGELSLTSVRFIYS